MQAQETMAGTAPAQKSKGPGVRYRLGVAVRTLAAIPGAYAVTALWAAGLARVLPLVRVEAALTATMIALVLYACLVMWCFAARTVLHAIGGLLLAAVLPAAMLAFTGGMP
ncbi:hypothetical protein IP91_04750 [Pseudoduganella lurida]|uniref:Iron transporter n=1 Tax=Pseudoduganella lurida TaxID=1036180 RepID=A0A562QX37_9BURK|nr:iron transporter [Pseudoduganella lurida]TWI61163.1 hypothetical protein IP91_04750 [Pseudoduganella lurida]